MLQICTLHVPRSLNQFDVRTVRREKQELQLLDMEKGFRNLKFWKLDSSARSCRVRGWVCFCWIIEIMYLLFRTELKLFLNQALQEPTNSSTFRASISWQVFQYRISKIESLIISYNKEWLFSFVEGFFVTNTFQVNMQLSLEIVPHLCSIGSWSTFSTYYFQL